MVDGKNPKGGPPPHVGGYAWRVFTPISGYLRVFPQGGVRKIRTIGLKPLRLAQCEDGELRMEDG